MTRHAECRLPEEGFLVGRRVDPLKLRMWPQPSATPPRALHFYRLNLFFTSPSYSVVIQNFPDCFDAILEADLFALFLAAAVVADANFIYTQISFGNSGGNFWLKTKALGVQLVGNLARHIAANHFVAGLHVSQVQAGKDVTEHG